MTMTRRMTVLRSVWAQDVPGVAFACKPTVLVTGYAKAPQGTSMYEVYRHAGIVLEIDDSTDIIVDAEFTLVTSLALKYLQSLMRDYDLKQGLDPLVQLIRLHYLAPSQEALVSAIKRAVQRYFDHKEMLG